MQFVHSYINHDSRKKLKQQKRERWAAEVRKKIIEWEIIIKDMAILKCCKPAKLELFVCASRWVVAYYSPLSDKCVIFLHNILQFKSSSRLLALRCRWERDCVFSLPTVAFKFFTYCWPDRCKLFYNHVAENWVVDIANPLHFKFYTLLHSI